MSVIGSYSISMCGVEVNFDSISNGVDVYYVVTYECVYIRDGDMIKRLLGREPGDLTDKFNAVSTRVGDAYIRRSFDDALNLYVAMHIGIIRKVQYKELNADTLYLALVHKHVPRYSISVAEYNLELNSGYSISVIYDICTTFSILPSEIDDNIGRYNELRNKE